MTFSRVAASSRRTCMRRVRWTSRSTCSSRSFVGTSEFLSADQALPVELVESGVVVRVHRSRASATAYNEPVVTTQSSGPAAWMAESSAARIESRFTTSASVSRRKTPARVSSPCERSTAGSARNARSVEGRERQTRRWSLSRIAPNTRNRSSYSNRPRRVASFSVASGLCAPSRTTSGSWRMTSNRPGQ